MSFFSLIFFCLICAFSAKADTSRGFPAQSNQDLVFERGDFMKHTAYRNIDSLSNDYAASGAYGPINRRWESSHQGRWYIEQQRFGADLITGGIALDDTTAIAHGLAIIKWGLDRESDDGSFDCPDNFHSAAFFIEAAAHSLLVLEASNYAVQFKHVTDGMKVKLHKAALWMIQPEVVQKYRLSELPYTHRYYMDAAAVGLTGTLMRDAQLVQISEKWVAKGISTQRSDGVNLEKGGYDSSYQALGLVYAERYYTWVAQGELQNALFKMLQNGVAWEASRVMPSGLVSTEGNSRVGGGAEEHDRGDMVKEKTVSVGSVFRVFAYWSLLSGDRAYLALAEKVAKSNHMSR